MWLLANQYHVICENVFPTTTLSGAYEHHTENLSAIILMLMHVSLSTASLNWSCLSEAGLLMKYLIYMNKEKHVLCVRFRLLNQGARLLSATISSTETCFRHFRWPQDSLLSIFNQRYICHLQFQKLSMQSDYRKIILLSTVKVMKIKNYGLLRSGKH